MMLSRHKKIVSAVCVVLFVSGALNAKAQTVLDVINDDPRISDFATAIKETGLESQLSSGGPYTVFVPSNKAFRKLSGNERSNKELLRNHIITGSASKRSLKYMNNITSLSGITIEVVKSNNNSLTVQSYPLVESNIRADNGVVHIIGGVIK